VVFYTAALIVILSGIFFIVKAGPVIQLSGDEELLFGLVLVLYGIIITQMASDKQNVG
jgi:hypothetical protein